MNGWMDERWLDGSVSDAADRNNNNKKRPPHHTTGVVSELEVAFWKTHVGIRVKKQEEKNEIK